MIAISTNQSRSLKFWLPGRVVPKARPRFNGGNISLRGNYRGWKNTAYLQIISQLEENCKSELLIKKASVEMQFLGSHRGDLDNERWGSSRYSLRNENSRGRPGKLYIAPGD